MIKVFAFSSTIFFFTVATITLFVSPISYAQLSASPGTPADLTSNIGGNPFGGAYEGPPRINIVYNNTEYQGTLDSYSFGKTESMMALPVFNDTVTSTIPSQIISIKKDSAIKLEMEGVTQSEARPDGISASAYTLEGKPAKVLRVIAEPEKNESSVIVDLNEGEYILITTATWVPQESNQITGYVSYSYRINVVK